MNIRILNKDDIKEAMALVKEVFYEFEAPGYMRQGIDEFLKYIEPDAVKERMESGELLLWGSFEHNSITGVIAVRPRQMTSEKICYDHVCLLFVKKEYHRRGIARALFEAAKQACAASGAAVITVNSSPYAKEAYRRLGFAQTDGEQTINGITFIPMKCVL